MRNVVRAAVLSILLLDSLGWAKDVGSADRRITGGGSLSRASSALWVAESEGILKLLDGSGSVVTEIREPGEVLSLAIDGERQVLWVHVPGGLLTYATSGRLERRVALSDSSALLSRLIVDTRDGSVVLASGRRLESYDASGALRWTLGMESGLRALAFDAKGGRAWISTQAGVQAYETVGGSAVTLSALEDLLPLSRAFEDYCS